jgi:Ca2+-binding RTX toxin-like protein
VDTASGLGGNDAFFVFGNLTAADTVNGGAGTDTVILNGDYSGANALVLGASSMTGVEAMTLQNGFNYDITTADANIAAAATLTVTALTGAGHTVSFNGAAETDGSFAFTGGASDDSFTGGALADSFDMSHGGNDTVHGGGGNDSFTFGNAFDGNDSVDGGAGSDTLTIAEAYTGSIGNVTNVETLTLGGGFSYNLTATDNTVAAGQAMTVNGAAATNLTFDGSAESDGAYHLIGAGGTNVLTGGAGNDTIDVFTGSNDTIQGGGGDDTIGFGTNFTAMTGTIDGGIGNDTLVLQGELGNFELAGFTNVETVKFGAGDYSAFTADTLVAAGQTLTIDASQVASNETFAFDGSAETDGHFVITDGIGDDTVIGGAQSDTFHLNSGQDSTKGGGGDDVFYVTSAFDSADSTVDGGTGNDTLVFDTDGGAILFDSTLKSVESILFANGHSYNVELDNGSVTVAQTTTIDSSAMTSGSLTFDGSDVFSPLHFIAGSINDNLTGGGGNDTFDMTAGGEDTVHAGTGFNTVLMGTTLDSGDLIAGGTDLLTTVVIAGDNYTDLALGGTLHDVGALQLTAGHSYTISADNTTMSDNDELLIDGGSLGASDVLTFTDTATIDSIDVKGGAANDVLTGSAAVETFILTAGGNDTVTGNGGGDLFRVGATGADTFIYNAVGDSTSTGFDTFSSLNFGNDVLKLNTGNAVTGIDATIASGFLTESNFDANLANNVNSGTLAAHHAVLFTATGGSYSGHTFLIVDQNGIAGYQASADLVFDVTGYSGTLAVADFT